MTTRAQLQSKSIDELREVAKAAGIDTDGLQKSKLITALMDAGEVKESKPTDAVELPKATPRSDKSNKSDANSDDSKDGSDESGGKTSNNKSNNRNDKIGRAHV